MTSLARLAQRTLTVDEVGERAAKHLATLFDAELSFQNGAPSF